MPTKSTRRSARPASRDVDAIIARLKRGATKHNRDGMARYGIPSDNAFGAPVGRIKQIGRELGPDHQLAAALWDTGWYEARMLATFIDEPSLVSPSQMDRWCRDFDSWAICDTACFALFDRTPHAWRKVSQWSTRGGEFQKRAAFALMASLALHDKTSSDRLFARWLPLIERAADDERNYVKKGVNWALRSIGRRSAALNRKAVALARRLAGSTNSATRWIGKDALRELTGPAVARRIAARAARKR